MNKQTADMVILLKLCKQLLEENQLLNETIQLQKKVIDEIQADKARLYLAQALRNHKSKRGPKPKLSKEMREKLPKLVDTIKTEHKLKTDVSALRKILEPMGNGLSTWRAKGIIEEEADKLKTILSIERKKQLIER